MVLMAATAVQPRTIPELADTRGVRRLGDRMEQPLPAGSIIRVREPGAADRWPQMGIKAGEKASSIVEINGCARGLTRTAVARLQVRKPRAVVRRLRREETTVRVSWRDPGLVMSMQAETATSTNG